MAVYKREGSPYYQIEFEYKGHRVRRSSKTTKKREAEELERKWRQELHDQLLKGKVADMSLGEAIDRYWDTVIIPKGNKKSAERDLYVLNKIRKRLGENRQIQELTSPVLSSYRDELLTEGRSPATVNRYLSIIRAILNRAKDEWGNLAVVPTFKQVPQDNARYRWLTDEEEERVLAECAPHLQDLVIFLLDTGVRKTEALELTWSNVDLDRKPRALVKFMRTKNKKPRGVPLTDRATKLLQRLKKDRPEGEERVFLYSPGKGKRVPYKEPYGAWTAACKRAGIKDATIHDLRHTYATRLVRNNVPLLTVSRLLGHSSLTMTMRYAHHAPEMFDEAIDKLGY